MIVDFENISSPDDSVPDGYDGLNFKNVGFVAAALEPASGYRNVLSSGENVAFNGQGLPCAISAQTAFSFLGGEFAAAWNKNLKLIIKGFSDGELVAKHVYVLDQDRTHIEVDDLTQIDRLVIRTKGGADADPGDGALGQQVAFDDLQLSFAGHGPAAPLDYDPVAVEAQANLSFDGLMI